MLHALREAEGDGHCHLPRGELCARARRLLGRRGRRPRSTTLAAAGRLVVDDGPRRRRARWTRSSGGWRATCARCSTTAPALRLRARPGAARAGAFVPTDDQWAVVEQVLGHRLSILTGGPGVGKTRDDARARRRCCARPKRSVRLCAPTGKAARRLGELTGAEATTIHRLLEYVPGEGFARDADDPIAGADVLVVDEASMLSVRLADALLARGRAAHARAARRRRRPARAGRARARARRPARLAAPCPAVRLTEIFRQAARSLIVRAAHAINDGRVPADRRRREGDLRDFFLIGRDDPAAIFAEVCDLAVARACPSTTTSTRSPRSRCSPRCTAGPVGIDALNAELRGAAEPRRRADRRHAAARRRRRHPARATTTSASS